MDINMAFIEVSLSLISIFIYCCCGVHLSSGFEKYSQELYASKWYFLWAEQHFINASKCPKASFISWISYFVDLETFTEVIFVKIFFKKLMSLNK